MTDFKGVLTVTLNPAIDRMVEIAGFHIGKDNRVLRGVSLAGGKGINVSRALSCLGMKSVCAGFAGGANGQNVLRDLLLEGLEHQFVFIQGETRVNLTICDSQNGTVTRVIDEGPAIDAKDLKSFCDRFQRLAETSEWIILSGRTINGTPKNFVGQLAEIGCQLGAKVIVDTSGDELLAAIKSKPFLLKINRQEAESVLKAKLMTADQLRTGLKKILSLGAQSVMISLGDKGAVATDGKVFYTASCPKVKAVSSVGCGDATTAGFVYDFERSGDFLEAFVAAVAAGTASSLTAKPGVLDKKDFEKIMTKIKVSVL